MLDLLLIVSLLPKQVLGEPVSPELPPVLVSDLRFFPPSNVAQDALKLANAHIAWLEHMRLADPSRRREWEEWLDEARMHKLPWQSLEWAHSQWRPEWYLMFLRMRLGPEAYWSGRMPPPVPLVRFREIR